MLPKKHKLPGNRIPWLLKHGARTQSKIATLITVAVKNPEDSTRIGIIVPLRLSKKATMRNRTRRLIREAIHEHLSKLTGGIDGIIISKVVTDHETLYDIAPSITQLLVKGRLISPK
jgi:ribonuclease P protein component